MEDDKVADPRPPGEPSRLSGCQMVSVPCLVRVLVQIGSLTIEDIGPVSQVYDLRLVLFVISNIDDIRQFLPPGDRGEAFPDVTENKFSLFTSVFKVESRGKPE